jgi:hypothetical protein
MAFDSQLRRIGLIDQQSLVRCLSPELMLVDPELARQARELLREPGATNGKGNMSTLLGTHEISSGNVLGLEPPLSPPVVHGPSAMTTAGPSAHVDLPSPPPALRPPESSMASEPAPTPQPPAAPVAPAVEAAPAQPEQAAATPPPPPPPPPAPVQQDAEPLMAPPLEPVTPQETEPTVIELKPVTTPVQDEPEIAAAAQAEPELADLAPELAPPAPQEPEAVAPEQPVAPPPPPEPIEQAVPEMQVIAPPAAVEEMPVELPVVDLEPPAPEPPVVEEPVFELPAVAPQIGAFRVVVRLSDGDGIEVGEFRDFGTAMQGAQEVIDQFAHSNGTWPFYAGRFIRPDLIISVDVVDAS